MIEAVIVLPVLLLTWAGVSFMHERYLGRQQAMLAARRCAWAHALAGCGQAPEGCSPASYVGGEPAQGAPAIMQAARASAAMQAIDVFDDIPVLSEVLGALFGTQTGAAAEAQTTVPWARELRVIDRTELVVLCNERPRDVLQAAIGVFCQQVSFLNCGGGAP